jgi:hypothetical protein
MKDAAKDADANVSFETSQTLPHSLQLHGTSHTCGVYYGWNEGRKG